MPKYRSETVSVFGFLNSRSGLGGVWDLYRHPRRGYQHGKLLTPILCAYLLHWGFIVYYDVFTTSLCELTRNYFSFDPEWPGTVSEAG
jgi:hypothetical protein